MSSVSSSDAGLPDDARTAPFDLSAASIAILGTSKPAIPLAYEALIDAYAEADLHLTTPATSSRVAVEGEGARLAQNRNIGMLLNRLADRIVNANKPAVQDTFTDDTVEAVLTAYTDLGKTVSTHPLYKPSVDYIASVRAMDFGSDDKWAQSQRKQHDLAQSVRVAILTENVRSYFPIVPSEAGTKYLEPIIERFQQDHPEMKHIASIGYHFQPAVFVNFSQDDAFISWTTQDVKFDIDTRARYNQILRDLPEKRLFLHAKPTSGMDGTVFEQDVRAAVMRSRAMQLSEARGTTTQSGAGHLITITAETIDHPASASTVPRWPKIPVTEQDGLTAVEADNANATTGPEIRTSVSDVKADPMALIAETMHYSELAKAGLPTPLAETAPTGEILTDLALRVINEAPEEAG